SGTVALGNSHGFWLSRSAGNIIGGSVAGDGNLISGNRAQGIVLTDGASNNAVWGGNYTGTAVSGAFAVRNDADGVRIDNGARNNTIGGDSAAFGNLISGNGASGVWITDSSTTRNRLGANLIGTNATGTAALPNQQAGVAIVAGAHDNVLGGTPPG